MSFRYADILELNGISRVLEYSGPEREVFVKRFSFTFISNGIIYGVGIDLIFNRAAIELMYREYFRISENPFSITPDPRFLFMGRHQREAVAHLLYGMSESGGFVQLTGEVGTGKTTLCRALLQKVPEEVDVALILNPKQTALELLASICDELHISYPPGTGSLKVLIDLLNGYLLQSHANGRRTALIIDEAQDLSTEVLEQIRLLTNLETTKQKLLQIFLIGQPELRTLLARPELRQLAQRITARYHLTPLLSEETVAYIRHRLKVVGIDRELFARGAVRLVHKLSGGVPRLINIICDRAMLGAYAQQRERIGRKLVRRAAAEVTGRMERPKYRRVAAWATAGLFVLILLAGWRLRPLSLLGERTTLPETHQGDLRVSATPLSPGRDDPVEKRELSNRLETAIENETGEKLQKEQNPLSRGVDDESAGFNELFKSGAVRTDTETAFLGLFRHWGLAYPDLGGNKPCDLAAGAGLRCIYRRGDWASLRLYNRPAVLELIDDAGRLHHVAIVSLEEKEVTLEFAGQAFNFPRAEVGEYWFGGFLLFWKPPFGARLIRMGNSGQEVIWIREQLEHTGSVSPGSGETSLSPVFDEALRRKVMDFQLTRGLKADGMVGEQTLIQLNTLKADPSIPLLCRKDQSSGSRNHVVYP